MNPFFSPRMKIVAKVAALALVLAFVLAACKTFDNAGANETIAALDERIAVMDKAAVDPEKTPEQREIARLKAEKFRADREKAIALLEEDAADDKPDPVEGTATAIGNAVAGAIPGAGVVIAAGIPIFFRARKMIREHKRAEELERLRADALDKSFSQTVVSIENAKAIVPAFAEAWNQAKVAVEAKQDESTKEAIAKIKTASQS